MNLKTIAFKSKMLTLPDTGRHLYLWRDKDDLIVYVPHIGDYYDDKTLSRPVWITPSFSWMMYHADWLESADYDSIECMKIQRVTFEEILLDAFPADFSDSDYVSEDEWKQDKANAPILFRWDNDYSPDGQLLERQVLLIGIHSRIWMQRIIQNQIATFNAIDEALFKQKEQAEPPYDLLIVPDEEAFTVSEATKRILKI